MNSHIFENWLSNSSKLSNKGVHFGHKSIQLAKTNYWHPLLSDYFLGLRHNVSVFRGQQSLKMLLRAFHILALILKQKGRVLIVNTHPNFFRLCTHLAKITSGDLSKFKNLEPSIQTFNYSGSGNRSSVKHQKLKTPLLSYVNYKWVGGTLTNWKQVSKSVLTYAKFAERCESFLVKNNLHFPKYKRVKNCFQGLVSKQDKKMVFAFTTKPDLILLLNPNENQILLNEASRLHIPVIAFTESNTNPKGITYPIPGNNYSLRFLYYCLKKVLKMTQLN